MTNSWILSKGYVFANHQLIESALLQSKTTPTVVVVDDPTNYFNGRTPWSDKKNKWCDHWNPEEKASEDAFIRLFEAAKPLKNAAAEPIELDFGAHAERLYRNGQIYNDDGRRTVEIKEGTEHDVFVQQLVLGGWAVLCLHV